MRITNSMMVSTSKININGNKSSVDTLNRRMSSQKKIVKPSDDPIIAVRSLRLRSSLSAIDQYYERNIPDSESWMEVTTTALKNINDIISEAYKQTVYGASDELNQEDRKTILTDLQALQEQVYSEGNADFEGRTIFTGYKTNQKVTFDDEEEAGKASYTITEELSYQDIQTKHYYTGKFNDTTATTLLNNDSTLPEEHSIKRIRLAYDNMEADENTLTLSYKDGDNEITATYYADGTISYTDATNDVNYSYNSKDGSLTLEGYAFTVDTDANGKKTVAAPTKPATDSTTHPLGVVSTELIEDNTVATGKYTIVKYDENGVKTTVGTVTLADDGTLQLSNTNNSTTSELLSVHYAVRTSAELLDNDYGLSYGADGSITIQGNKFEVGKTDETNPVSMINKTSLTSTAAGAVGTVTCKPSPETAPTEYKIYMNTASGSEEELGTITLNADDTLSFTKTDRTNTYKTLDETKADRIILDKTTGELLLSDSVAEYMELNHMTASFTYNKTGFDVGELRPENYFACVNKTNANHELKYDNFDEDGEWITQAISYNIANGQSIQINTEARDVFDCNVRRDMDELIDIVHAAIVAQDTVDEIKKKMNSGLYEEDSADYRKLRDWLDAANKQLDYANQNMHDTYSAYISRFQGYLDKADMAVTDAGSRGERIALTKTRMNAQQTVYEDLKSQNEDAELSDLVIDYSAAYVAYQAALQAAGKIGKMTLLDYI